MQPDPLHFLLGIRRVVLSNDLFGAGLSEGLSPIIMHRAGETLLQLTLRYTRLPQILRDLLPQQIDLLEAIQIRFEDLAKMVAPQLAISKAIATGVPGEEDIRAYEGWVQTVANCIAVLSERARDSTDVAGFLHDLRRTSSTLEMEMRRRYNVELDLIKGSLDTRQYASRLSQPTGIELTQVLRKHFPGLPAVEARNVQRHPGVTSKETFFFDLVGHPDYRGPMVLRREPEFNPTRTFVADELDLLNELRRAGLPVPRALMANHDGEGLGAGYIIVERLPGEPRTPENLGVNGKRIALEVAAIIARAHRLDPQRFAPPFGATGKSAHAYTLARIDNFYERWTTCRTESSVTLESAFSWLRENIACLGPELSLVHGDFNYRNILLDGDGVSAILDWELAHPGHAAEDLAYIRPDIEKIMPWSEFLSAYVASGGVPASPEALKFFDIWSNVWRLALSTNCYTSYARGEHQNFLFASVGHNEYYAYMDPLCAAMAST